MISGFRQNDKNVFIQYTDVNMEEVMQYLLRTHLIMSKIPDNLVKIHINKELPRELIAQLRFNKS